MTTFKPGAICRAHETLEPKYKATWRGRTGSEILPTGASFIEMLNAVLSAQECTLSQASAGIGISVQYLHDLKSGRRLPSVEVVNKICDWMGRGPKGRLEWHVAGAAAHGWKTAPSADFTERVAVDGSRDEKTYAHKLALQILDDAGRNPDSDISVLARHLLRAQEALRNAYEIYAGSEGFLSETAAEEYQKRIIEQMIVEIQKGLSG